MSDVSIVAVGDVAPGVIGTPMKLDSIFSSVKPFLKGDIVFGNLEGVLLNKNIESTKKVGKNYFSLRLNESNAKLMKDAGFTILNFNNNHCNDYGEIGRENTKKVLESVGIKCLEDSMTVDSIAFLSFYLHSKDSCVAWSDSIQQLVQKLKKHSKILIVSIHGGKEGSSLVRDTCEKHLGEYRGNLYEFSHKSIDAGANVVLCHGPHVVRSVETYKNKIIAHSLGNFCTPFGFKLDDEFGRAIILKICLDDKGDLKKYDIVEFKQVRNVGITK
jgi:poly-gamma-glutamate capsule biosynthesis protein CapA/YwtB (metallophosphatase superfamily)